MDGSGGDVKIRNLRWLVLWTSVCRRATGPNQKRKTRPLTCNRNDGGDLMRLGRLFGGNGILKSMLDYDDPQTTQVVTGF